jgi:NNP family nitrate/nitrite transporter-like MFS transporter
MAAAAGGVMAFLPEVSEHHGLHEGSFPGFLAMFLLLFLTSGIGNGSTFRMIPVMFLTFHERRAGGGSGEGTAQPSGERLAQARKDAAKEGAAVIGFSSAVAAYGAFFIPRAFGISMKATGSPAGAFVGFIAVYLTCIAITWWVYARRNAEMPC